MLESPFAHSKHAVIPMCREAKERQAEREGEANERGEEREGGEKIIY